MRICVLGQLAADPGGGVTAPKQRALLELLALHRGQAVSTERLADGLWGDEPPGDPAGAVAFHVSQLRALLGDDVVETTPLGYRLAPQVTLDVDELEELVEAGRRSAESDPVRSVALLEASRELWRGPPYPDLVDLSEAAGEIARLEALRLEAEEARATARLRLGDDGEVVADLERLVASHPLRERAVGLLMEAMVAAGRPAEAVAAYEECRRRLATELGVSPGPALERRHLAALRADVAGSSAEVVRNPYKGLRAFTVSDVDDFYGREAIVDEIVGRLAAGERTLVAVGPSGSGKSSLLQAGVIAALRAEALPGSSRWPVAVLHPGSHPFEELEAALAGAAQLPLGDGLLEMLRSDARGLARTVRRLAADAGGCVVVVDQFEELYHLPSDPVRQRFEDLIAATAGDPDLPVVLLLGIRADHLDRLLSHRGLATTAGEHLVVVPPLDAADLERAVACPADGVGLTLAPALVGRLVGDVVDRPGELPLLEYTLTRLVDECVDGAVDLPTYDAAGGVAGCLAGAAEELHAELTPAGRDRLRRLLLDLVAVHRTGAVRRCIDVPDQPDPELADLLDRLDRRRLITFDRDPTTGRRTVEPAHEALFRAWPRLARWIDDHRDDLRARGRLVAAADEWVDAGHHDDYLLRGTHLTQAQLLVDDSGLEVGDLARRYLERSTATAREREARERQRDLQEVRLRDRARRRSRLLVVMTLVIAFVVAMAAIAVAQRDQAHRANAQLDRLERSTAFTVAALTRLEADPETALLYGVEAMRTTAEADGTVQASSVDAVHWALQAVGAQYPTLDVAVIARPGPGGLRGYHDLAPDDLGEHAVEVAGRWLTEDECALVDPSDGCGSGAPIFDDGVRVVGREAPVDPERPLAGTTVAFGNPDPVYFGGSFLDAFTAETGIEVTYPVSYYTDFEQEAATGELPDLAIVAQPGVLPEVVASGLAIDLAPQIDRARVESLFGVDLADLVTVGADGSWPATEGVVAGLWTKLDLKSLLWYPADDVTTAGLRPPTGPADIDLYVEQLAARGDPAWCLRVGTEDRYNGWPGTDWIEDEVLRTLGPDVYADWVAHDIPFDDPRVVAAASGLERLVNDPVRLHEPDAVTGVFNRSMVDITADPPRCWLWRMANYLPGLAGWAGVAPEAVDDLAVVRSPATGDHYTDTALVAGTVVVAFDGRPEVRALLEWLMTEDHQAEVVTDGYTLSPVADFDPGRYPTDRQREMAGWLDEARTAGGIRFDGSDLMPADVATGRWDEDDAWQRGAFLDAVLAIVRREQTTAEAFATVEAAWQALDERTP